MTNSRDRKFRVRGEVSFSPVDVRPATIHRTVEAPNHEQAMVRFRALYPTKTFRFLVCRDVSTSDSGTGGTDP